MKLKKWCKELVNCKTSTIINNTACFTTSRSTHTAHVSTHPYIHRCLFLLFTHCTLLNHYFYRLSLYHHYFCEESSVISWCGSSNSTDSYIRMNILNESFNPLSNNFCSWGPSNIEHFLQDKLFMKMNVIKNISYKSCSPNLISSIVKSKGKKSFFGRWKSKF